MIRIREITSADAFAAMRERWTALVTASRNGNVFLTWEWLYSWWEVYGAPGNLAILAAEDDTGRLVGLAPLFRSRRWVGLRRLCVLGFLGGHSVSSEYLDFVTAPGLEAEVTRAFLGDLRERDDWDILGLYRVREGSETLREIDAGGPGGWPPASPARLEETVYLALPDTFEAYLGRVKHQHRYNVRKVRKRLDASGRYRFEARHEADLAALAELEALHQVRMTALGRAGSFASERFVAFHHAVARRTAERGWLRLYFLREGDRAVAARHGYAFGGVFYDYSSGFDPAHEKEYVGFGLLGFSVERCIEEGLREFDFLSPGEYKERWEVERRTKSTFTIGRVPAAVAMYRLQTGGRALLASGLRRVTPHDLHRRLRTWRQRMLVRLNRPLR